MRYCEAERLYNDTSSFRKARSFVNKYMRKIVVMLLDRLEIGDVSSTSESSRIKSCLESAMKFAISELRMTMKHVVTGEKAKAIFKPFDVIAEIFDETRIGYDLTEKNELLTKLWDSGGLKCLETWLGAVEGTELFPDLVRACTILTVLEQISTSLIESGGVASSIDFFVPGKSLPLCVNFPETVVGITKSIIGHLASLPVAMLEKLDDDSIEVCKRIQQLYEKNGIQYFSTMFVGRRSLILKLISSSSWQLKILGWRDLQSLIKVNIELRPYPQAYLVEEAGLDFVNGLFVIDPKKKETAYVQKLPENNRNVTLKHRKMSGGSRMWTISSNSSVNYHNISRNKSSPHSGLWKPLTPGATPAPKLIPLYLCQRHGRSASDTLEHHSLNWIVDSSVLELAAKDCNPNASQEEHSMIGSENHMSLSSEASKAMKCMLDSVLSLFDVILQTLPVHSYLGSVITTDTRSEYETVASRFATMIMQHFLLLGNDALNQIDVHFTSKACESLQEINERLDDEHLIDFWLFRGFLLLRLLILKKSPNVSLVTELEELSGVCLDNYPPKSFIVEGAGSDIINGQYVLNMKTTEGIAYTKEQCDVDDNGLSASIYLCEHGPEANRWVITYSDIPYYVNVFEDPTDKVPPQTGWTECGGVNPPPNLTAIGVSRCDIAQTEKMQELESRGITEQQRILWSVLEQLSLATAMPVSRRSKEMKESVQLCLVTPNIAMSDLQRRIVSCAHLITQPLFQHLKCKRQLSITPFLVEQKRKKTISTNTDDTDDWFPEKMETDMEGIDDVDWFGDY
jgi:hypothetical protein